MRTLYTYFNYYRFFYLLFGILGLMLVSLTGRAAPDAEATLRQIEQAVKVTGKVTSPGDEGGLPGVNILVKGTNIGTITDVEGNYTVSAPNATDTLIFSFIGYIAQEVPLNGRSVVDVVLEEDVQSLEEVVVIGYGTAKKSDLTGSVARISGETFENQPMTQVTEMLTGTVAGVNMNQGTSAAGGGSIQIRGPKSLNASTEPMVVLDGVIYNGSISDINPNDIENIDILKDASSAAVYGARAAAGVVLITTKKGTKGKPVINFTGSVGMAEPTNSFGIYDGEGYINYRQDVLRAYYPDRPSYYYMNPNQLPSGVTIEEWRNASNNSQADNEQEWLSRLNFFPTETENYLAGRTVDWYDKVIRKGFRQNYDVSIRGGSDNVTYYWSLGYQKNEGVIQGDEFSTIRTRLNLDYEVTDWLNVGINAQFADNDSSAVSADLGRMYVNSPYGSMYNEDGSIRWYPNDFVVANPLIDYYGQNKLKRANSLFASIYGNVKLPLGISYKLSFQPRYVFMKDYNFWPSETLTGGADHADGYGTRQDFSQYEWLMDNILKWNKEIGVHSFDVTFLYNKEFRQSWSSFATNEIFLPNQLLGFNALQYGANPTISDYDRKETGDAIMGRLNYILLDKYLLTVSVRRDGYSAFGQSNPRATFPAAALAWRISEEEFFPSDVFDHMKLRFSWGVNGNRDIGAYSALAQIEPNLFYNGSNVVMGVYNSSLSNPGLVWERTESFNFGLDFGLFNNRIDVSADYYDMTTTDLLMNRQLPEITGFTDITTNLGELGNRGFEFSLNTVNVSNENLTWKSSLVFSLNRNKIKKLFGDFEEVEINGEMVRREVPDYSNGWFPGKALDVVWDYDVQGIWQQEEESEAAVYRLNPGDYKARDVDENGVYEDLQDKMFIGYTQPRYRLGLRNQFSFLKHFTASVFLRAELGHLRSFAEALRSGGADTYDRRSTYDLPYWTPENPINDYPRLNNNYNVFGGGIMIYKKASYVRIQDVSLAYSIPNAVAERLRVKNMRVFGSVRNLYSFDKWPGWDPESGMLPMPRSYSLGINFSL